MIPSDVSVPSVSQAAAVVAALPGCVALIGAKGDVRAASEGWQALLAGGTTARPPEALFAALRAGHRRGAFRAEGGTRPHEVTWEARPFEGDARSGWLVSLAPPEPADAGNAHDAVGSAPEVDRVAWYGHQLERLYHVGTATYDSTDALLRDVLNIGCDVLEMPVGAINVFRGNRCQYRAVVPEDAPIAPGDALDLEDALCFYVSQSGETVVYADLGAVPERHDHVAYREQGVRSYVGTPLLVNGQLYGALFFADFAPHAPFDEGAIHIVELMARRVEREVERQQADAALKKSQDMLVQAQRLAHLGSWQWDAHTDEVLWSDEVYRIFGLPIGTSVDFATYQARLHPDDVEALQEVVQRALTESSGYDIAHRVVRPDGAVRHVESSAEVVHDEQGHRSLVGTVQDVTERVHAHEALRESEERYRFITEHAADIIGRTRADGVPTYVSPAVEAVLGRRPDEFIGQDLQALVHPDDLAAIGEALADPSPDLKTLRYRMRHGQTGQWIWLEARYQALFDPRSGAVSEFMSSVRDVSEQVRFEETLRRREARMRLLNRITSGAALGTDEQVRRAVHMATEELGMHAGVLARVSNRRYHVRAVHAPGLGVNPGDTFPLPSEAMIVGPEADDVVTCDLHEWPEHPAAARFGQRAFLGVPIRVKGAFYGSLSFWHDAPREAFAAEDREFVQLLGLWLGALLERGGAEAQVRNSRNLLRSLLTSSLDGIMAFESVRDASGKIADFTWILSNPRADEIVGRPPGYLMGRKLLEEMPAHTEKGLFDAYVRVVETGEPFEEQFPYYHDGLSGWFHSTAVRLDDGFFVTFRDITSVRQASDALRESEARFRLIAEHARDLVCVCDEHGTFSYVSPSVRSLLGHTPEEMVGQSLYGFIHPEDAPRVREAQAQAAENWTATYRMQRADGSFIWVETASGTMREAENAGPSVRMAARDVTDRILAEQELARANQTLQQRNRELQDFAYVASHDLQEPLRKIRAFADLLVQDAGDTLDEESRHYLSRIEDAATRMATLISDLLTFSRVTTRGQPFQTVSLEDVVEDMLQDLEIALHESGGHVEIGTLPVLEADPLQMRQLFQNLIANALKFRREGVPPRIEVRAQVRRAAASDTEAVVVEVEDNGIGFDEKYLDRIFTPFQRLHNRQQFTGTGMGLAICRRIVERHQGQITARSTPGQGTTFIITLPRTHSPNAANEP